MKPVTQKSKPVRSKALRAAARDQACVACSMQDETVVLAHLPNPGDAGRGIKCDDYWGAWLCWSCHTAADHEGYRRDYEWRSRMIHRTLSRLIELGIVEVKQ